MTDIAQKPYAAGFWRILDFGSLGLKFGENQTNSWSFSQKSPKLQTRIDHFLGMCTHPLNGNVGMLVIFDPKKLGKKVSRLKNGTHQANVPWAISLVKLLGQKFVSPN